MVDQSLHMSDSCLDSFNTTNEVLWVIQFMRSVVVHRTPLLDKDDVLSWVNKSHKPQQMGLSNL